MKNNLFMFFLFSLFFSLFLVSSVFATSCITQDDTEYCCNDVSYPFICFIEDYPSFSICGPNQGFCDNYVSDVEDGTSYCRTSDGIIYQCCYEFGYTYPDCLNPVSKTADIPDQELNNTAYKSFNLNDYFSNFDSVQVSYYTPDAVNNLFGFSNSKNSSQSICYSNAGFKVCLDSNGNTLFLNITSLGSNEYVQLTVSPYNAAHLDSVLNNPSTSFYVTTSNTSSGVNDENCENITGFYQGSLTNASSCCPAQTFLCLYYWNIELSTCFLKFDGNGALANATGLCNNYKSFVNSSGTNGICEYSPYNTNIQNSMCCDDEGTTIENCVNANSNSYPTNRTTSPIYGDSLTQSSRSVFGTLTGVFLDLFPSSLSLTSRQKFAYVFITCFIVSLLLLFGLAKFNATSVIVPLLFIVNLLLIFYFFSISYLPISLLIILALIGLALAYFKVTGG